MKLDWTPSAKTDLAAQFEYIAAQNFAAAVTQEDRVLEAADRLATYPHLGRVGRLPDSRELVVAGTPFIIVYRVMAASVVILNVLHGAQPWPPETQP